MIKRLLAILLFTACAAEAADWEITRQIKVTNSLLREANQEQRYQVYLRKVAYYAEHHPDSPPPKPELSKDPADCEHNIWLVDQWLAFTHKWEEENKRTGITASVAPSEAELESQFQEIIAQSRAKRERVYPESVDPSHPIHEAAEKIWKNIEDTGHSLLHDPDAPFKVYEMAALSLGLKPTGRP